MTEPSTYPTPDLPSDQAPEVSDGGDGGDVVVDPADLDDAVDTPATTDPDQMVDDADLGGTAGQGGAG